MQYSNKKKKSLFLDVSSFGLNDLTNVKEKKNLFNSRLLYKQHRYINTSKLLHLHKLV